MNQSMKRALILAGKYTQDHEFIYPYYRLKEEEFEVIVATEDGKETVGALGIKIPVDIAIDKINLNEYNLLIIPGGAKAMEYIRQNKNILELINKWNKEGKIIASICHGSQLLISAGVVRGRKISGYYSIKDDINNAGAVYVDAPYVTDKNIITSPHYKHMGPWMKESLKIFYEKYDKTN